MRPNLRVGGERRGLLPAVYPLPLLVLVSSCVSYQPAPLDSAQILAGLNELRWVPPAATGAEAAPDGSAPTREQLASFAILHNPSLRALRAEIGVADSLLVQAGLLPDPTIGWDAMDVVAAEVNGSGATSQEYLSGLGVEFPLLRPGERDARKAVASLHAEEARLLVTLGEWALAREVFLAYERVVSSRLLLEQNAELAGIAQNTHEYFERARESGASTAIEANLALGDLQAIRLDAIGLESQLSRDEQHLRALLGLPPGSEVELRTAGGEPEAAQLLARGGELVELALRGRPDLALIETRYAVAEQAVRLEIARQFPSLTVGSGLSLVLPVFSRFNRPAIETALARREAVGAELTSEIHRVRAAVAAAQVDLEESSRELAALEAELLPNVEESLRLASGAFSAGEAPLLQILTVQRSLIAARTRHVEARAEQAQRAWTLMAEAGLFLHTDDLRAALSLEQLP